MNTKVIYGNIKVIEQKYICSKKAEAYAKLFNDFVNDDRNSEEELILIRYLFEQLEFYL